MLIALTDGELDWDEAAGDFRWSEATPLPRALKNRFANEPRWIDLRPYRGSPPKGAEFMGQAANFAAAIRGIPKKDLLSEEVRQQRRARRLARSAAAVLLGLSALAFWQWRVAERQRGIAEAQTKVAEAQTKEAQIQRNEAQTQQNQAQLHRDKAHAELLAMQARRAETRVNVPDFIELGGALALESAQITRARKQPAEADAVEAARSALIGLPLGLLSHAGGGILSLAALADGRLASGVGEVSSLAVLADGGLASGGQDGNIKLWPKEGMGEPVVLSHGGAVLDLAVLKDGRLASAGKDGRIKLWLVDEEQLVAALCLRAGRNLTKAEWARYVGTPRQRSCRDRPSNWRTPDS